jgi:archaemetzincin
VPTRTLQLVPVGSPPASVLKALDEPLAAQVGMTVATNAAQLPTPNYAFNKDRNQYHCSAILRRLAPLIKGRDFALGITDVDLFIPELPFVFGESDREARAAVISVFRLQQGADPEALRHRLSVEALHQVGHLLGLSNCEDPRCAMFLATNLAECDRKAVGLCNVCRSELAKLSR